MPIGKNTDIVCEKCLGLISNVMIIKQKTNILQYQ